MLRSLISCVNALSVVHRDLFNAAFLSCWSELSEDQQDELIRSIELALTSQDIAEVTQTLLNLAEFMEHSDKVSFRRRNHGNVFVLLQHLVSHWNEGCCPFYAAHRANIVVIRFSVQFKYTQWYIQGLVFRYTLTHISSGSKESVHVLRGERTANQAH